MGQLFEVVRVGAITRTFLAKSLIDQVFVDMTIVQLGWALDAPAIQLGASGLGVVESVDLVAPETAHAADRAFTDVEQLVVRRKRLDERRNLPLQDRALVVDF